MEQESTTPQTKGNEAKKSALLVGVQLPGTSDLEQERSFAELKRLVHTLGLRVAGSVSQKLKSTNAASLVGPGKLLELAKWTGGSGVVEIETHHKTSKAKKRQEEDAEGELSDLEDLVPSAEFDEGDGDGDGDGDGETEDREAPVEQVDFVVFDAELTPSQSRNLEKSLAVEVMDRTGVIVEIFHRHAQTPAARAQVEIARLTYLSPRMRETGPGDRQGGGIGAKGAGETRHELDKRRIRDRIAELRAYLKTIHQESALRRTRRKESVKLALVGYTNAGKSSLMRALTGSEVLVADKLFATLDTTVRPLLPETKPKILATDTVGFIQKLPHELVASFQTTLDEALDASLLLYVVDASDASFRQQLATTVEVLSEIEASDVPHLLVLNKVDCISPADQKALHKEYPEGIFLCTRDPNSVASLRNLIIGHFEKTMVDEELVVPYAKSAAVAEAHSSMRVVSERHDETGTILTVRGFPVDIARLKKAHKLL